MNKGRRGFRYAGQLGRSWIAANTPSPQRQPAAGGALPLSAVSADALHCGDGWGKALSWGSGGTRMALEGAWVPGTGSVQGEERTAAKGTRAQLAKCVSLPCSANRPSCLPGHDLDLLHLDVPGFSPRQTGNRFCCWRQCLANHAPLQLGAAPQPGHLSPGNGSISDRSRWANSLGVNMSVSPTWSLSCSRLSPAPPLPCLPATRPLFAEC